MPLKKMTCIIARFITTEGCLKLMDIADTSYHLTLMNGIFFLINNKALLRRTKAYRSILRTNKSECTMIY